MTDHRKEQRPSNQVLRGRSHNHTTRMPANCKAGEIPCKTMIYLTLDVQGAPDCRCRRCQFAPKCTESTRADHGIALASAHSKRQRGVTPQQNYQQDLGRNHPFNLLIYSMHPSRQARSLPAGMSVLNERIGLADQCTSRSSVDIWRPLGR